MYKSTSGLKNRIIIPTFLFLFFLTGFSVNANENILPSTPSSSDQLELETQAENLFKIGKFQESQTIYRTLYEYFKKNHDYFNEALTLIKLGFISWNLGKINDSSDIFFDSLYLSEKYNQIETYELSQKAIEICSLYLEGKKLRNEGQRQESIEHYSKAIEIAKKKNMENFLPKLLRQMSISYWELSNYKKFFSLNEEVVQISNELSQKREQSLSLINLGIYYRKINEYSKSLSHYEKALNLSYEIDNQDYISACLNNMGNIYKDIGNFEKSISYLKQALSIERISGNKKNISIALNNLGETLRTASHSSNDTKQLDHALEYFYECFQISEEIENQTIIMRVLNNIGTVKADLQEYYEALSYFEEAFNKATLINDKETMGMVLNNKGIVFFNLGDYANSTKCYQNAIDLALGIEGNHILWEAYLEIANTLKKQNKYLEALENYKKSISVIEDIRSNLKLEKHKASYFGTNKRIRAYHNIIHLLVNLYDTTHQFHYKEDAFFYLERAKARAFLDRIELSQIDISQGVNVKLLNREKEIMKDISSLYTSSMNIDENSEKYLASQWQLKELEDKLETLRLEIRNQSPSYANLKYPEIINLNETQRKFGKKGVAVFEYILGRDQSYAFVITKGKLNIFPLPGKETIIRMTKDYLKCITDRECNDFNIGSDLFTLLVEPGLNKKIKNIVFIPDDILLYLPFEALIEKKSRKWLVENYKISYAPSISSLKEIKNRKKDINLPKPQKDIFSIGAPQFNSQNQEGNPLLTEFENGALNLNELKYSAVEIEKIQSIFKRSKTDSLIGDNASEDSLKKADLKNYKIIHFATHSIINDKIPERSSIILCSDNSLAEDGLLQMREIYNLQFNSDLITLSACQTGLGQLIIGEGVEGLNRAFFYSGASSVLMSLWSINDQATSQLMERFYNYLKKSISIKDALKKAKIDFIKSESLNHPYYWAGFIVSGDSEKHIFSGAANKIFIILLIMVISIIIFIYIFRIRKPNKTSRNI